MRRLLVSLLATLTCLGATLALTSPTAVAGGTQRAGFSDPTGDVKLFAKKTGGLTKAERRSIDISRVRITEKRAKVRFAVRIDGIDTSDRFHQMAFIRLRGPKSQKPRRNGFIGMSPQQADLAFAYAGNQSCDPLTSGSNGRLVFVDVPRRCVPRGRLKVKVTTATGFFRSDAPVYSRDKATLKKATRLRG